ncbi:MAG: zinc ribbon domain-containing protein [Halanaeroarchaeum sp.]
MKTPLLRRRPLLAGLLGVLYPGLGHAYLRAWVRAVAWFGLAMVTAAMVVPESAFTAFQQHGLDGLLTASRNFPLEVTASLLVVRGLNVVDAYLTGLRQERATTRQVEAEEGATCPNCGGELDPELDFCPWCTTRLAEFDDPEDGTDSVTVR